MHSSHQLGRVVSCFQETWACQLNFEATRRSQSVGVEMVILICERIEIVKTRLLVTLTFGLMLAAGIGNEAKGQEVKTLEGDWTVTSVERNKNELPAERRIGLRASFRDGKFTFHQGDKILTTGTFQLDPGQAPRRIDLTWTDNDGKQQTTHAIYEIADDQLKICGGKPGEERPGEFVTSDGSGHTLTIFAREKL
jgi:uncharacterized protein (TIGR03067 family)